MLARSFAVRNQERFQSDRTALGSLLVVASKTPIIGKPVEGVETLAHLADAAASIAVVARVPRAYTPPLHCIRSNAIVNVSRGYAAITSCRKE